MTPTDRRDPAVARLPRLGAAEFFYRLDDGRVLGLGAEGIGFEEGVTTALFDARGQEVARLGRDLWLGTGFLGAPRVAGPRELAFEFPDGTPWRLSVHDTPGWLSVVGLGPLRLRRG
jgi:hypothetical protein